MMSGLSKEFQDILIKNASGIYMLLKPDGILCLCNQNLLDRLEQNEESIVTKSVFEINLFLAEDLSIFEQSLKSACELGQPVHLDSQIVSKKERLAVAFTFSPVKSSDGSVAYVAVEGHDNSRRKNVEQQLSEEQIFSKVILNSTPEGIVVFDPKGNVRYLNERAKHQSGLRNHQNELPLKKLDIFDFYSLDGNKKLSFSERALGLALQGEEVRYFKEVFELKDVLPPEFQELKNTFEAKTLSISSRIVRNRNGDISSIVISSQDITKQREARLAQIELQERFSHAFENAVVGIAIVSSRGAVIDANRALASMLGYQQSDLINKSLKDITHPDDLTLTEVLFSEIEAGISNSVYYETKLRHKNGLPIDTIVGISVSRDDKEQIDSIIAHILNVTENNQITKALALSQDKYQSIFNSQLDAVVVTNLSGKILNINPAAIKLFGYGIDEIDGLMLWELYYVSNEQQLSIFEDLYKAGEEKIHTDAIRYLHKNGEAFPAETVGFLLYDGNGQRLGYTWIIQDISEKKIAEITLARVNQRLAASREEERRRLARELHDGVVQDLVGFSYELASYEAILTNNKDKVLGVSELQYLGTKLRNSIKQLRGFISDLRPVGLEEFGFKSAIESYVALLDRDLSQVTALSRTSSKNMPTIVLDIEDVGDLPIPINLCLFRSAQEAITNVRRHAKANKVTLTLSTQEQDDSYLLLTIQDDGTGFIVPDDISHLASNQHFGLIGISERISMLDGKLLITSKPDFGTTLSLRVPYEKLESDLSV